MRGCACRGTAARARVVLGGAGEDFGLGGARRTIRTTRCKDGIGGTGAVCAEQKYHGDVNCALGWACWKTYLGRPETDWTRSAAMTQLGNGRTM